MPLRSFTSLSTTCYAAARHVTIAVPMNILGLDIGSSSVKAGIVRGTRIVGSIVHQAFDTHFDGVRAEVPADGLLRAIAVAIAKIGAAAENVEAINLSVMSPAWVAMDKTGKALTPIVTHQDRRSIEIARWIESRIGKANHLRLAGNRPFPGGISSTTCAWFLQHEKSLMRRADLVGHLNTFLHRQLTGARIIDPSNASFTGLYETVKQGSWNEQLCAAVGIDPNLLPDIIPSNTIGGYITASAARRFGLTQGTPVLAGMVDTSAAMMLTGAKPGQLLNVSGSTDVLAMCCARPHPRERLLTRALGIGKKWMSVATLAASGSSIHWIAQAMYRDLAEADFYRLIAKIAKTKRPPLRDQVIFEPWLAGDRTSIEQKRASFTGLSLATGRDEMLAAVIESLVQSSGQRMALLRNLEKVRQTVFVSGGLQKSLGRGLYRDWAGHWRYNHINEASLRGLGAAAEAT